MIPFLKKNKDGKKPPKSTVPRTAQESIPFQRMFEDGTCRVRPGYYTRTIQYQDINYQLAQQEDKTAIFEEWCSFLNFFDSSIHFELSFVNTATDSADFEKSIRIPYQQDGFDDVRAEYSQMLRQQLSKGNNGLTKTKFLTYGIEGDSMAQVKPRLEHIQNDLMNNFTGWASGKAVGRYGASAADARDAEHGWSQQVPLQLERPCAQRSVRKGCYRPHCAGVLRTAVPFRWAASSGRSAF